MSPNIATDWHFSIKDGETKGPVSLAAMQNAVRKGHLRPHHLVWHESLGAWMEAGSVDLLKVPSPPPVAPSVPESQSASQSSARATSEPRGIVQRIQEGPWAGLNSMGRAGTCIKVLVGIYVVLFVLLTMNSLAVLLGFDESGQSSNLVGLILMPIFSSLVLTIMIGAYALPSSMAYIRQHRNAVPIMIVNLAFGWTFFGWIASLAWSFTADVATTDQTVRIVRVKAEDSSLA